jgi:hypothetical protein
MMGENTLCVGHKDVFTWVQLRLRGGAPTPLNERADFQSRQSETCLCFDRENNSYP